MAERLETLLDQTALRDAIGVANAGKARTCFSVEGMVAAYRKLFDNATG